jgi:Secreted repeat of unknown function
MTRRRPIGFLPSAAVIALVPLIGVAGAHVATAGGVHPAVVIEPSVNPASVTRTGPRPTVQPGGKRLGQILIDSTGRALYLFEKDTGAKSRCSDNCAGNWLRSGGSRTTVLVYCNRNPTERPLCR